MVFGEGLRMRNWMFVSVRNRAGITKATKRSHVAGNDSGHSMTGAPRTPQELVKVRKESRR